ncbi:hypothetical protein [Dyadobacter luticola]|uniref:Uncharacterized protein n=1 Tax=Dyadobacter luticola TaxID=1979387 RepID=A0A5R9KVX1_9BACT|nr:hypothetical protein [Dyadobacter luticola]TLV00305.1 hypothetical protein FEN17_12445 [Dyadobacter luticola]
MKNLVLSIAYLFLSFTLFCCNDANNPQPVSAQGAQVMSEAQSGPLTSAMQVSNPITDRPRPGSKFEWQLATTATLPYLKGMKLTAPFAIVEEAQGDISWGNYVGCYTELKAWTMPFAELGIVDVKTITPESLKTLTYYLGTVSTAPANSTFWKNELPNGAVLAYKDAKGKMTLVRIKGTSPLVMEIYKEHYYTIY